MKEFIHDSKGNAVEDGQELISYEYCGGKYPLTFLTSIFLWTVSNILQALFVMYIFDGKMFFVTAIFLTALLALINIACTIVFIVSLVNHARNTSTGFRIYKDRITGKGLYRSDKIFNRKYNFDFNIDEISSATIEKGRFVVRTHNNEEASVIVNTRDFKRNLTNVLYYNQAG